MDETCHGFIALIREASDFIGSEICLSISTVSKLSNKSFA
jgi:hypothetical protein